MLPSRQSPIPSIRLVSTRQRLIVDDPLALAESLADQFLAREPLERARVHIGA